MRHKIENWGTDWSLSWRCPEKTPVLPPPPSPTTAPQPARIALASWNTPFPMKDLMHLRPPKLSIKYAVKRESMRICAWRFDKPAPARLPVSCISVSTANNLRTGSREILRRKRCGRQDGDRLGGWPGNPKAAKPKFHPTFHGVHNPYLYGLGPILRVDQETLGKVA
jgi:hypothetical protein